jgi:hypothetical protein
MKLLIATVMIALSFSLAMADTPLPEDMKIVSPGPEVPANIARYSGSWIGNWSIPNRQEVTIVIERIEPPNVFLINSWGFGGASKAGYSRAKGVIEGENVVFETKTTRITLILHPTLNIMNAEILRHSTEAGKGGRFTAELKRKPKE